MIAITAATMRSHRGAWNPNSSDVADPSSSLIRTRNKERARDSRILSASSPISRQAAASAVLIASTSRKT